MKHFICCPSVRPLPYGENVIFSTAYENRQLKFSEKLPFDVIIIIREKNLFPFDFLLFLSNHSRGNDPKEVG